MSALVGVDLI